MIFFSNPAAAKVPTDATSGLLPDLPPDAVKSYLQYRFPLQLAADFYIFDLQAMVADTGEFPILAMYVNPFVWCFVYIMSVDDCFLKICCS